MYVEEPSQSDISMSPLKTGHCLTLFFLTLRSLYLLHVKWLTWAFPFITPHQMTTAPTISLPTKWLGCTATWIWSTTSGWWILNPPPSPWLLSWPSRTRILSRSTGCRRWEGHFIRGTKHCSCESSWFSSQCPCLCVRIGTLLHAALRDSDIRPPACFSCMTCAVPSKSFSNL